MCVLWFNNYGFLKQKCYLEKTKKNFEKILGTQILQKTANYFDPPPIINHYSLPIILAKTGRKIRLKLN